MSSVGFVPGTVKEIETLREAWKTLNDVLRNLASAEAWHLDVFILSTISATDIFAITIRRMSLLVRDSQDKWF